MAECSGIAEILQGHSLDFTVDATNYGDTVAFEVQVYTGNAVAQKFRYPETDGFAPLVKNGYIYEGVLTSAMTDTMLGIYGLIPIGVVEVGEDKKGFNPEFVKVNQKPL